MKVLQEKLGLQFALKGSTKLTEWEKLVARLRGSHACSEINWKGMKWEMMKSEIKEPQKRKQQNVLFE